jgi:hypothetical protein
VITLGIDPGVTGAVAAVQLTNTTSALLGVRELPIISHGKLKWIDGCELLTVLRDLTGSGNRDDMRAYVEHTHAMPKMGVVAASSKGLTLGSVLAALQIAGISVELVSPQVWKRALGLISPGASDRERKAAAMSRARLMFPSAELDRVKDHNRAEALLLAAYGVRFAGGATPAISTREAA